MDKAVFTITGRLNGNTISGTFPSHLAVSLTKLLTFARANTTYPARLFPHVLSPPPEMPRVASERRLAALQTPIQRSDSDNYQGGLCTRLRLSPPPDIVPPSFFTR